MKSNIIFLDIDGVLNGYNWFTEICNKIFLRCKLIPFPERLYQSQFGVCPKKMKMLAELVESTNSEVVLTSSMRDSFWFTPYELKTKSCKRLSDAFREHKIKVTGITPSIKDGNRGQEIQMWIDEHLSEFNNIVVFDDENTLLPQFVNSENFIQTSNVKPGQMIKGHWSENTGLKRKHIKKAKRILMSTDGGNHE